MKKNVQLMCKSRNSRFRRTSLTVMLTFLFSFVALQLSAQTIVLTPASNPSPIVKLGEGATFSLNIFSPGSNSVDQNGAYLDITPPANWKFVSSTPAATPVSGGKYRISGLDVVVGYNQDITVTLVPLCAATANAGTVKYELFTSGGTSLRSNTTASISNFQDPILNVTYPQDMAVNLGEATSRDWGFTQTGDNTYIKGARVEISCASTAATVLSKVEYYDWTTGQYEEISTPITTTATKYTYYITADELKNAGGNPRLEKGENLELRETFTYVNCAQSGQLSYQLSYGDGTDWCAIGTSFSNALTIIQPGYVPDFSHVTMTYPTKSDGTANGKIVYRVYNNSSDPKAIMKDIKARVYCDAAATNRTRPYIHFFKAYFSNASGAQIAGTPEIPLNNNGVPGKVSANQIQFIVSFDELTDDLSTYGVPLIDSDGDGTYGDLPYGTDFYFTAEYSVVYDMMGSTIGPNNTFNTGHRQGYLYYKNLCGTYSDAYYRGNGGTASTYGTFGNLYITGAPVVTLDKLNVSVGDQATMSFTVPGDGSNGRAAFMYNAASTATYKNVHKVYVTIPEGFNYDPALGIKVGANTVAPADITYDGDRTLVFQNKVTNFSNTVVFNIGLKAVNVPATDKNATIHFSYSFEGEEAKEAQFSQNSVPVTYTQILPCSKIELTGFTAERTTFGYTDVTMATPASKATGARVTAAGPYDNVSHTANVTVKDDITMSGTDKLLVKLSYKASQVNPYFIFADANSAVKLTVGGITLPAIPSSALTVTNTNPDHSIVFDLTSYVTGGTINLTTGATFSVEFLTQVTANIPLLETLVTDLVMEVYREEGGADNCSPMGAEFYLRDYKIASLESSGGQVYEANIDGGNSANMRLLRWQIGGSFSGATEVFTNEFRPNATFRNGTVVLPGLYEIKSITFVPNGNSTSMTNLNATFTGVLTKDVDYSVTYSNGQTTVTLINDPASANYQAVETWNSYINGYVYNMNFNYIGGTTPNSVTPTITSTDYPTSANPQTRVVTGTHNIAGTWNFYSSALSSPAPNSLPLGSTAEWTVRVTNTSIWTSTDGKLPHSWLAVEAAAGVLGDNVQLYDATGNTLIGNFTKIADGKYWIKLEDNPGAGYLTVQTPKEFVIKSDYTACNGMTSFKARYGMSLVTYPDDPWTGYMSTHNTPRVYNTSETTLTLTPPDIDFNTGIDDSADKTPAGLFTFCSPFTIDATFYNGMSTEIKDLSVNVTLPAGLELDNTFTPQVKIGSGSFANYDGSITYNSGSVTINGGSAVVQGIGSNPSSPNPNANVTVRFKLKPVCGFDSGTPVYMALSGAKGCGTRVTKQAATGIINIAGGGGGALPLLHFSSMTVNGADAMNGTAKVVYNSPTAGEIDYIVNYVWDATQTTGMSAYIDIPASLTFISGTFERTDGTVYTQDFTEVTQSDPTIRRLSALFDSPTSFPVSGIPYTATIKLQATDPAQTSCTDEVKLTPWAGVATIFTCNSIPCSVTSVAVTGESKFTYDKVEVTLGNFSAEGRYKDDTYERITFTGNLDNLSANDYDGPILVEFYLNNDGTGTLSSSNTPATGNPSFIMTNATSYSSQPFTEIFDIKFNEACKLMAVVRKSQNPYICEDVIVPVTGVFNYTSTIKDYDVCQNESVSIGEQSVTGYTYSWSPATYLSNASISNPVFAYTGAPKAAASTETYTLTITRPGGCSSTVDYNVNLKGMATINTIAADAVCAGVIKTYTLTGTGDSYKVESSFPSIVSVSVSGTTLSAIGYNNSTNAQTSTITVTPVKDGCEGTPMSFVITVNPVVVPAVSIVAVPGASVCAGTSVTYTATPVNGGTTPTYQWKKNGTNVGTAVTYTNATPANGDIIICEMTSNAACPAQATVASSPITMTVTANPTVSSIAAVTLCSTENKDIYISGTAQAYTAVSNNSAVTVSFPSNDPTQLRLIANNAGTTVASATITVTPVSGDCKGTAVTFIATVNPMPKVNAIADQVKCSGTQTTAVTFAGNVTGGSYKWVSQNQNIGLTNGTGASIAATTVTNNTTATLEDIITVTPTYGTCEGIPTNFYIHVNPTPTVNTIQNAAYCAGDQGSAISFSGNVPGTTYNWTSNNNVGFGTSGTNDISNFTAVAGTATLTVTPVYTNYGVSCNGTAKTATITVTAKPVADFSTAVTGLGQITFTNASTGATSYAWNFGDGTTSTAANPPAKTYAVGGTYTVSLTATTGSCSTTMTKTITVNTTTDLEAVFAVNPTTQCQSNNSFTFLNQSKLTTPGYTISAYSWDFGDNVTSTVANPPAKTYSAAGTYTVTLTVTAMPGNIKASTSQTVTVLGLPVITDGTSPAAVCDGGTLQVNMPTINWNNNTPVNGIWLLDGKVFDPSSMVYVASNGKKLQYQVSTACGTVTSTGVNVTVNANPVADFTTAVTGLGKIQFTNASTGATTYNWNYGNGVTSTAASPEYTYPASGTYNVSLTATNGNCSDVITKTITVYTSTDLEAKFNVSPTTQCLAGNSFTFNNQSAVSTPGYAISAYSWSFGDGGSSTVANPPAKTYAAAGNYTVTLTVTAQPGNIQSTTTQTVVVQGLPVITDGTAPAAICDGEYLQVNTPTINWNNNTPVSGSWLLDGKVFNPSSPVYVASNGKLLQYQVTTDCGTVTSTGVAITVNANPVANFTTTVTGLAKIQFTNTSTGATTYSWNFGDGSTSTAASPEYTYPASGTYTVTLTATSGNCSNTITKLVTVYTTTDLEAKFNISPTTQCLAGNSFTFYNQSKVTTPGYAISAYSWDFGNGNTSTAANPPAVIYAAAGNYVVTLTVTVMPGNITSVMTQTMTVIGLPAITDGAAPVAVCAGELLQVNTPTIVWNNNTPVSGEWLLGGKLFDPTITPVIASDNGKLLQYRTTTTCGVVTSTGVAITVNPAAETPTYMDINYCNKATVAAITLGSAPGVTYKWEQSGDNIGLTTMSGTNTIPSFTAVNNGSSILTATFTVTAINGTCEGKTVQFSIKVAPEAKVSSDLTVPAICGGSAFVYDIQSLTAGAEFNWTRVADADINGGATSTGTTSHIEEVLTNTGTSTVTVQYQIEVTTNICNVPHIDILTVDVKPTPAIALTSQLIEVCPEETVAKLPYTTAQAGMGMTYSIVFGNEAIYEGMMNISNQPLTADTIEITLPSTLAAGYYNGTISLVGAGGCASTESYTFTIQKLEPITITEQPQAVSLCSNDGLTLSVTATGKGLAYQWYKHGEAISGATSSVYHVATADESHYGDYYVVITSACETVMSNIVTVEGNGLVLLTKWDDVIFVSNADKVFTAYQWYKDGKAVASNGTYQYYTQEGGLDGNYQVKVTYGDGSVEMSCPYTAVKTAGTNNPTIHIYPNPVETSKEITIDMSEFSSEEYVNATVDLFNLSGQNVAQIVMDQPVQTMIINVPAGTYVVRITTATGKIRSEKIVVTD